jgi:alpha-ketoglutarate-dependent taurine dioxygenase
MMKLWLGTRRLVILRGFAPIVGRDLVDFCQQLGEVAEGDFGTTVGTPAADAALPVHFDGLLGGPPPRFLFFVCEVAPPAGTGGQSLFCDTTRLLRKAAAEQRSLWAGARITCRSADPSTCAAHSLISRHPTTGEEVLRFAEPTEDGPVRVELEGLPAGAPASALADLCKAARDPAFCYEHAWQAGDMLLADNHALLHGRRACSEPRSRQVKRFNIL